MRSLARAFVNWQVRLSHKFDAWFPAKYRIVGRRYFRDEIVPAYLKPGLRIYDVGGGSAPYINRELKRQLNAFVVGLDIDSQELQKAPEGSYDKAVVADITTYRGGNDADLVICQATLEHVRNTEAAFASFASILKPEGHLLIVVPCRNAVFARINLLLPETLKRTILFNIFPHKATGHEGFPAFYDRCTPQQFRDMATRHGFAIDALIPHFYSSYFSFFLPAFVLWRVWVLIFSFFRGEQAAEVFSMICRKTNPNPQAAEPDGSSNRA